MKILLVLSALVAVSCASSFPLLLSVSNNEDGTVVISMPGVASLGLPETVVNTLENLAGGVGLLGAVIPYGTSKMFSVGVAKGDGGYSFTFNSKTFEINSATIAGLGPLVGQLKKILSDLFPVDTPQEDFKRVEL